MEVNEARWVQIGWVVEGFGAKGFKIERHDQIEATLTAAKKAAAEGTPVLINAYLGKTDFRKGSLTM